MKPFVIGAVCISIVTFLFHPTLASAAVLSDVTYSLTDIDNDPSWNKIGGGSIVQPLNLIADDLVVSRTFSDAQNNNFLIEANISASKPAIGPAEAGARMFARIRTDDLPNPLLYREMQVRFQKEVSDADNFVGLYNNLGTLLTDVNNNEAKILVDWNQTAPRSRLRLRRVSGLISLDLLSPGDNSILQSVSVALNNTNFPTQGGIPDASILGFGNLLGAGNTSSWWEDIRVATWEEGTNLPQVPLPASAWLFFSGLVSMFGLTRRRMRKS